MGSAVVPPPMVSCGVATALTPQGKNVKKKCVLAGSTVVGAQ